MYGNFILVDHDKISLTNINRQIHANHNTIGKYKVDEMKKRILEINPNAKVETFKEFYLPDCKERILDNTISYVVDSIDTVTAKIELVVNCEKLNIPIISAMGTGNKLDPTKFEIVDIYKTKVCPLAKVMRKELRKRGINSLKVLYSQEKPLKQDIELEEDSGEENYEDGDNSNSKKQVPGSISFVPSVAGLIIAGEIVKDIIKIKE